MKRNDRVTRRLVRHGRVHRDILISMRFLHPAALLFLLTACAVGSGCTPHLNRTDGLQRATLPALDPAAASFVDDQPSITAGFDRSHWQRMTVTVPVKQVEHHPTYTHELLLEPTTRRAAGRFPTVESALEIEERTFDRSLESPLNIVGAGVLIVFTPFDMVFNTRWPHTVERGSSDAFERITETESHDRLKRWLDLDDEDHAHDSMSAVD